jgi:hypothetical protein
MASNGPDSITRLINKIGNRIAKKSNRIEIVVLKTVEGLMKRRIFNSGIASDGSKIGNYSTRPILVGASSFANKSKARNVLGSKKRRRDEIDWRTVKGRRLAVFPGGYKQLRRVQGFQTAYVDLEVNGDLRRSIVVGKSGTDNVIGFFNDDQRIIGRAQEDRFKKDIFAISTKELKEMDRAFIREVDAILKGL